MNIQHSTFLVLMRRMALVAVFAVVAAQARALDCPATPPQWFNDTAGVVNAQQAQELNDKLRNFEQSSGAQVIVYVMPSIEGDSIERFTVECAQKWGVGNKKYDNGLILFVFVNDRKVRVEVGYGLEGSVTDAYSSRVIRDYIAPHFQQNDYAGGLDAAVDALMAKIRGGEAPVPPVQPQGQQGGSRSGGGIDPFFIFIIVVIFLVFILPMLRGGRRRGGCGGCFWPMFFPGGGTTFGGGGSSWGGGGGFGGGGGGFSGGGGSFGGGGATGGW